MRRRKWAATFAGLGAAAALVLPVSGAFADPVPQRPAVVQAQWNGRDGYGQRRGYDRPAPYGNGRYDGYNHPAPYDGGRYYGHNRPAPYGGGRYGGYNRPVPPVRHDRDGWRDGRRHSNNNDNLAYALGGVLLGVLIGHR